MENLNIILSLEKFLMLYLPVKSDGSSVSVNIKKMITSHFVSFLSSELSILKSLHSWTIIHAYKHLVKFYNIVKYFKILFVIIDKHKSAVYRNICMRILALWLS